MTTNTPTTFSRHHLQKSFIAVVLLLLCTNINAQKDNVQLDIPRAIENYRMQSEVDISLRSAEAIDVLIGQLRTLSPNNVEMVLHILNERHILNKGIVAFSKDMKGKWGTPKYMKSLEKALGKDLAPKAMEVIDCAQQEESYYPRAVQTLQDLKVGMEQEIASRTFPTGKLKSVYYYSGGGMTIGRYVFELFLTKDDSYELKTIRPGTSYENTILDKAIATYSVDDAFIERIINALKESNVLTLPKKSNSFPYRLLDAPSYRFKAVFEDYTMESNGDGTLQLESILQKIVKEEAQ